MVSEIAQKHKLHPTQINLWKKQLLDGAEEVFFDGRTRQPSSGASDEPESAALYEQIGRLKVQLEWLKKKVAEDGFVKLGRGLTAITSSSSQH